MTLRTKLLLAQLPLAIALALVGSVAVRSVSSLAVQSQRILDENYRSVLAAQRMKDALSRTDNSALTVLAGHKEQSPSEIMPLRERFEQELKFQEGNITEEGEQALTDRLRAAWTEYQQHLSDFLALADKSALADFYFGTLQPSYLKAQSATDKILTVNQEAMVRKSDEAKRLGSRTTSALVAAATLALLVGLAASIWYINRLLVPMSLLTQAVGRLGEGDFKIGRAHV
jgi:two-component system, NtrC family, sensor histidine kinase KinB